MKKKKILFLIVLLLIIAVPFTITFGKFDFSNSFKRLNLSASAVIDKTYEYGNWNSSLNRLLGTNVSSIDFAVNQGVTHHMETFYMHEAIQPDKELYYHGYCLHMGKRAGVYNYVRPSLTAYTYKNNFGDGVITNRDGNAISSSQLQLLQDLLSSGYHFTNDHTKTIYRNTTIEDERRIFVKQILVWEIVEGGRTSFSSIPDYHAADSAYAKVITGYGSSNNLQRYYNEALEAALEYRNKRDNSASAPIFGKEYTMTWGKENGTNQYTTGLIDNKLGEFSDCKSDNTNLKFRYSNDRVAVYSAVKVDSATVTCTYTVPGNNEWIYYKFTDDTDNSWQDVINGEGGGRIEKQFTVKTEGDLIRLFKKDENNQPVKNAHFTMTLQSDPTVKFSFTGNALAQPIDKSGTYILVEDTPPYGYTAIKETLITIDLAKKTITHNNPEQMATGYKYDSETLVNGVPVEIFKISITDYPKQFSIKKVNEKDEPLKGAKFKMYDGSSFNNEVKFDKSGNIFNYNKSGSVTEIYDKDNSVYNIQLLPKGTYKVVEEGAPESYTLSTDASERTYYIQVSDTYDVYNCGKDSACKSPTLTVQNTLKVKNYKSKITIYKTGNGGKPLAGVKFVLLDEKKEKYVKSDLANTGYNYNSIVNDASSATVYETNAQGKIEINNLPVGTYYLKEIATVDPYKLPDGDDAYTKLIFEMKTDGPRLNGKTSCAEYIFNTANEFNFYKIDENGNYLSGGKYKIQKYNDDKGKYEDIKVVSVPNDGTYQEEADIFKVDEEKGKVQFTLSHGIATFIEMKASTTYRVIELEAPSGYEVANVENSAVIKLDKKGFAKGSATIINQIKSLEGSTAQAELVIEIQTGKKVVRYGLIIAGALILIIGLMGTLIYISKKRK